VAGGTRRGRVSRHCAVATFSLHRVARAVPGDLRYLKEADARLGRLTAGRRGAPARWKGRKRRKRPGQPQPQPQQSTPRPCPVLVSAPLRSSLRNSVAGSCSGAATCALITAHPATLRLAARHSKQLSFSVADAVERQRAQQHQGQKAPGDQSRLTSVFHSRLSRLKSRSSIMRNLKTARPKVKRGCTGCVPAARSPGAATLRSWGRRPFRGTSSSGSSFRM